MYCATTFLFWLILNNLKTLLTVFEDLLWRRSQLSLPLPSTNPETKCYLNKCLVDARGATFHRRIFRNCRRSIAQEVDERVEDVGDVLHGRDVDDGQRVRVF